MNEKQIEKKAQREAYRLDQFQQRKRAEELTNGITLNAALELVGNEFKEEEIITVSAQAAGDKAASWAAKCAEQNHQYPSRTLCYSVPRTPSAQGRQKGKAIIVNPRPRRKTAVHRDQKGAS